jgi:glycosyltransferase involved in cell wall biosynthesis
MLALDRTPDVDARPLEEFCELIRVPHSNKNSLPGAIRNLFYPIPYSIEKYNSAAYRQRLTELLRRSPFDIVHADHLHMAQYADQCRTLSDAPFVLREHNVESTIVERFSEQVRMPLLRQWVQLQARRMRFYESRQASICDACCVITDEDGKRLSALAPCAHIEVVPAGVDDSFFESRRRQDQIPDSVVMFGSFDWAPNRDALDWFVARIFPRITAQAPKTTLYVFGKEIPSSIVTKEGGRIVVRGFAPDIKEELPRYQIAVVPLRVGGGMRLKILESFALRVPVVSTSIGAEGIDCEDGVHYLRADTEEEFARAVVRLLQNHSLSERLAQNACLLVEQRYRWKRIAQQLETVYEKVRAMRLARYSPSSPGGNSHFLEQTGQ